MVGPLDAPVLALVSITVEYELCGELYDMCAFIVAPDDGDDGVPF